MPLKYSWFLRNQPIGEPTTINISHGDMYIMSSKAVGTDWKKSSIPTLRHAAGCEKYISVNIFEKRAAKKEAKKEKAGANTATGKSSLTLKEMKQLAKDNKIVGFSKMNKGELTSILKFNDTI